MHTDTSYPIGVLLSVCLILISIMCLVVCMCFNFKHLQA